MPTEGERKTAFFDLDRTLIDGNSAVLWAKHEHRRGGISTWQLTRSLLWSGLYHLSLVDIERAYRAAVHHYRGVAVAELEAETHRWFDEVVAPLLLPAAAQVIEEHKRASRWTVLLTSTSPYEADIAARTFGLDDWIANDFHRDADGRLTGTFEPPLCFGAGKVTRAERWATGRGISLEGAYFYTDSYSDVPMLERVEHPRVVNPDPRLRRAARESGWPILDWNHGSLAP